MRFCFLTCLLILYFFTSLSAQSPNPGEVVINEILSSNTNGARDENAELEDWIELYNRTNQAKSLFGLYLTDKRDNPDKWEFPNGTFIPASGFLIVWADEDSSQGPLHANFKLSVSGEFVMLSNGATVVHDSISFGVQQPDISFGRYPNGTGPFVTMPPSFSKVNSLTNSTFDGVVDGDVVRIFPNPVAQELVVRSGEEPLSEVVIYQAAGQIQHQHRPSSPFHEYRLEVGNWPDGLYIIQSSGRVLATFLKM